MGLRHDDAAAASALAFIMAGVLFLAAISVLVVTANDKVPPKQSQGDDGYATEAQAVLDLITDSPGIGWNSTQWALEYQGSGAYSHRGYRPSLVNPEGTLDVQRVATWRTGCAVAVEGGSDTNTCVDEDIVRERLGLGDLVFYLTLKGTGSDTTQDFTMGPEPPQLSADNPSAIVSRILRLEGTGAVYRATVQVFLAP